MSLTEYRVGDKAIWNAGREYERERIIKSLDIDRVGSHALDDLIDTLIFMNISRSDFKRGLIEIIKGETSDR